MHTLALPDLACIQGQVSSSCRPHILPYLVGNCTALLVTTSCVLRDQYLRTRATISQAITTAMVSLTSLIHKAREHPDARYVVTVKSKISSFILNLE